MEIRSKEIAVGKRPVTTGRFFLGGVVVELSDDFVSPIDVGVKDGYIAALQLREFDEGGEGMGFRENFATLAEILEMAGHGVMDFLLDFGASPASGDAPGQVGTVGGVARAGFFNDDQIFFHDAGPASQASDSAEER